MLQLLATLLVTLLSTAKHPVLRVLPQLQLLHVSPILLQPSSPALFLVAHPRRDPGRLEEVAVVVAVVLFL